MSLAVTGASMLSSVGGDLETCFAALCEGNSGRKPLQAFDTARYRVNVAYEITDRRPVGADRTLRATGWLGTVVAAALADAGLDARTRGKTALVVGTGLRELRSLELWWTHGDPLELRQLHFASELSRTLGAVAPAITLSNACSASSFALAVAEDLLACGDAVTAVVAGADSISESMFGLADRANPLHPQELEPFARDRRGVILGEGAAAVVLEAQELAEERGARVRAWLRGVGVSCDAHHETAPSHSGVTEAMRDAHRRAGIAPAQVDLVMAHGTGTALNDENELRAFETVFGQDAPGIPITAIKSMTGHTSGASGLIAVVTAIESMRLGRIPPTLCCGELMPEAQRLDVVLGGARASEVRVAQVNAFGFGGVNAVAILEAPSP